MLKRSQKTSSEKKSSAITVDPDRAWSLPMDEIFDQLVTDPKSGLSNKTVEERLKKFGRNKLRKHKRRSYWKILLDQFKSLIIWLLIVAAIVSLSFGETLDFWAIMVVVLISTLIGFVTEYRAVRSMEALYKLGRVRTRVLREGKINEIDAERLVPGDVVVVEGGDIITADLRIIEGSKLLANESSLTGESNPVDKQPGEINQKTVLAERENMLYKGTAVTRGSGTAVVISTGMETELGTITKLVHEATDEQTPLEVRLDRLGNRLIWVTLFITIIIVAIGLITGRELLFLLQTGVALAVATIPEGLPIVATIALAKGVKTMADRNALIRRISSVETLGSTQVIFTDKTGTLTENRMTVTHYLLPGAGSEISEVKMDHETEGQKQERGLMTVIEIGMLCNNSTLSDAKQVKGTGDPLEVALLAAGETMGVDSEELSKIYSRKKEEAFNPDVKMMAVWNQQDNGLFRVSVKGAPGAVLDVCDRINTDAEDKTRPFGDSEKKKWKEKNRRLASQGLRILALAFKRTENTEGDPYQGLVFAGLVALLDPPRKDVKEAIEMCKNAGIRVVMVTGDQVETARYIASKTGLETDPDAQVVHGSEVEKWIRNNGGTNKEQQFLDQSIFARVSPAQKLDLIELFQSAGYVVAMTGDGVNDAPALKKADIGIAMGKRGSQVAREASDMVLTDDAFSSIVAAIEQGRLIFKNIRSFITYLMSCNLSEVTVVAVAFILGTVLPILPLQILFLNLVTDVFPALALGVSKGEKNLMSQPPRKESESILTNAHWIFIAAYGGMITISVMSVLYIGLYVLNLSEIEAVTLSFLTLALAQLWHVFNMRSRESGIMDNSVVKNPFVWGALVLSFSLLMGAIFIHPVAAALTVVPPDAAGWLIVIGFSLVPLVAGQIYLFLSKDGE